MGSNTALMDNAAALPRGLAVSDERRGGSDFGSDESALAVGAGMDDPDAARFLALAVGGDDDATMPLMDGSAQDDDTEDAAEDEPQETVYAPVEDNPRDESLQMWMRKTKSTKLLSASEEIDLARRVAEMFPKAAHLNVIRSWAGVIENTPDGRPIIDRLNHPANVTVATLSGVGFGLSPASGHAIRDLVVDGTCSFAEISKLGLARFAALEIDWRERRGWAA